MEAFQNEPADADIFSGNLLPREVFQEIMMVLRGALPPPAGPDPGVATSRDRARRDRAAMAAVASLLPVTAAEGRLAAQFVAADAWALDCLRLAEERQLEPDVARKCRAQAASLMREGKSALRLLLRLQEARRKTEKDAEGAGRAAWTEHAALRMMEGVGASEVVTDGAEAAGEACAGAAPDLAPFREEEGSGSGLRPVSRGEKYSGKNCLETEVRRWLAAGSGGS